jgi:hypothetical protein
VQKERRTALYAVRKYVWRLMERKVTRVYEISGSDSGEY